MEPGLVGHWGEMDTFALASVHVQLIHPQDGFRFRFRNHGAQAGNVDLWHIDYVTDDFLDPDNLPRNDRLRGGPHAMTSPYSVMPWTHYLTNPASFIADSARSQHGTCALSRTM